MGLSIFITSFTEPYDNDNYIEYVEIRKKRYNIDGSLHPETTVEDGFYNILSKDIVLPFD